MCELPIFRCCTVIVFLTSVTLISLLNLSALYSAYFLELNRQNVVLKSCWKCN